MTNSTRTVDLELNKSPTPQTGSWSFDASEAVIPRLKSGSHDVVNERSVANGALPSTSGSFRGAEASAFLPILPRPSLFGLRAFKPLYQWEGVVQEVNGEGFRARLLPIADGKPDNSSVEFADFEYDDLADESDLALVAEGAVFYWTIGKTRTRAGQITKTSLVRFRRLPPTSGHQARHAADEAEALLTDLGGAVAHEGDSSN